MKGKRIPYRALSFRAKRGISRSTTERPNYEILRVAQDDRMAFFQNTPVFSSPCPS